MEAQIHAIVMGTTRLGPGYRASIWFQGCPFRCPGCIAPETLPFDGGMAMEVDDIVRSIREDSRIDGVTCSGGEPFAQASALAAMLGGLQAYGYGTIVFSGYRIEYLMRRGKHDMSVAKALRLIDVLVDGVYIEGRNNDSRTMRGSDNQRIHYLTERYKADQAYFEVYDSDAFEMRPTSSGDTMLVGIPSLQASGTWKILAPIEEDSK